MRHKIIYSLLIFLIGCVKSNPVPITPPTPVVTIPNAPTDFKGILSSSTQIDLTWTDASNNEDGFKIERKAGTDAYSLLTTLSQNVVTYSDKGLTPGTSYTYRVFSYNSKGNSNNSNEFAVKTEDAEVASLKVGLVAYYPFTGNAGDSSGNGNHGTINGAILTNDRFGIANSAYSFNSINDLINVSNFNSKPQVFSISLWSKILTSWTYTTLNLLELRPNDNVSLGGFALRIDQNDQFNGIGKYNVYGYVNDPNLGKVELLSQNLTTINQWKHYVLTYTGSQILLYINGVLVSNQNYSKSIDYTNATLQIGNKRNLNDNIIGNRQIDDIRIYNRILTAAEIVYLYNH